MNNIKEVAEGNSKAYKDVKNELEFAFNNQIFHASSELHQAINLLWLLPDTEKREALREKLYALTDELSKVLDTELEDYKKEWENQ